MTTMTIMMMTMMVVLNSIAYSIEAVAAVSARFGPAAMGAVWCCRKRSTGHLVSEALLAEEASDESATAAVIEKWRKLVYKKVNIFHLKGLWAYLGHFLNSLAARGVLK